MTVTTKEAGGIQIRIRLPDAVLRNLATSAVIVQEEMTRGLRTSAIITQRAVKAKIRERGLILSGRMMGSVRYKVTKGSVLTAKAVVDVGTQGRGRGFYAAALEKGAVITPKRGEYLTFPIRSWGLFSASAGGQSLKRERLEVTGERWVRVRQVTIRPRKYFEDGVNNAAPAVDLAIESIGVAVARRIGGV